MTNVVRSLMSTERARCTLAFAAAQTASAFSHQGNAAARLAHDELVRFDRSRRLHQFFVAGIQPADPDVLRDGSVQEGALLKNNADAMAQGIERDVTDVDSVDADRAGVRIARPAYSVSGYKQTGQRANPVTRMKMTPASAGRKAGAFNLADDGKSDPQEFTRRPSATAAIAANARTRLKGGGSGLQCGCARLLPSRGLRKRAVSGYSPILSRR